MLELDLPQTLDICHAWGAILLMDGADGFLNKREMNDVHRNRLVSSFLQQLEYFQGILFWTTNRVETFDEAFQSRIHFVLRYHPLDRNAKRTIFKMFVERARMKEKKKKKKEEEDNDDNSSMAVSGDGAFTEDDFESLAWNELNGHQIRNLVISAQDLAASKGELLSMRHVRQILAAQFQFHQDLKGGTGYQEAMRGYC